MMIKISGGGVMGADNDSSLRVGLSVQLSEYSNYILREICIIQMSYKR